MANGTTGTTPSTGGLNYADYQKQIQEAAAKTRNAAVPTEAQWGQISKSLGKKYTEMPSSGARILARQMVSRGKAEAKQVKGQAEKAATALEMVGSSTLAGVQNLESIQGRIREQVSSASESWNAAAEKADEYVKAARGRVGEVLNKLDSIFTDIQTTRDFSKAHAMQASVQAVMGSMKDEERNIVENYGTNSKEYAQFQASKRNSLATVQSNIHATYAQLEEQQKTTYLNAVSDSYTKSNMYLGFQEQQHVEMLKYADESRTSYALQGAQLEATIEQMKMQGMENLANWLVESPTFSYDITPLATTIVNLDITKRGMHQAEIALMQAGKSGKQRTDWGAVALQAAGTAAGAAIGGPIGAAVGGSIGQSIGGATSKNKTQKTSTIGETSAAAQQYGYSNTGNY